MDDLNATAPSERSETAAVINEGRLILFGGISKTGLAAPILYNDLWSYDLKSCVWTQIIPSGQNIPSPRSSHSTGHLTDGLGSSYLLLFSGRQLNGTQWTLLRDLWLFSFDESVWIPIEMSLNIGRVHTSLIITQNLEFWFFGGCYTLTADGRCDHVSYGLNRGSVYFSTPSASGSSTTGNAVSAYVTMYAKAWSESVVYSPMTEFNHRAVQWKDSMLVHGGSIDDETQVGHIWEFSMADMHMYHLGPEVPAKPITAGAIAVIVVGALGLGIAVMYMFFFMIICLSGESGCTEVSILFAIVLSY